MVDEDLDVHLLDVRIHGRGVLSRAVAAWLRSQYEPHVGKKFPLTSIPLGNAYLQDIAVTNANPLKLIGTIGGVPRAAKGTSAQTQSKEDLAMVEGPAAGSAAKAIQRPLGKKLDIYIIDTGWNEEAREVLDNHLDLFESFLADHNTFALTPEQSKEFLSQYIELIGEDPILVMVDSDARVEKSRHGYGVRICLGAMPPERIRDHLKRLLQIVCDHRKSHEDILRKVRKEAHKEGFDGAMELIGEMVRPE
jgi:hypothetical protein